MNEIPDEDQRTESHALLPSTKSIKKVRNPCKLYVQDLIYKGQLTSKANKETLMCITPGCTLKHIGHHPRRAGTVLSLNNNTLRCPHSNFLLQCTIFLAEYCPFTSFFFPHLG